MTHLKDPVQKSVVDGCGCANGSVGKEEGSEGGEDSVDHGNGAVHRQVKLDIGAHVVGRERLQGGGQRRPGWVDVNVLLRFH